MAAWSSGRPVRGLELLEPVRPFDHAQVAEFWPAYLSGEAQLQLKHDAKAAAEFRSIIDHRGELVDAPLYPLAHLGLARALVSGGDPDGARQAYLEFLTLWKDADANLLPLQQARREFARLPRQRGRDGPTKRPIQELFPLMYNELRRVAGRYLGRERSNHTLQPTALVNEAWLRLQNDRGAALPGRTQGLALAAQAMRARARGSRSPSEKSETRRPTPSRRTRRSLAPRQDRRGAGGGSPHARKRAHPS